MFEKIVQQLSLYSGLDESIQTLSSNIKTLGCQEDDINEQLEEAKLQPGKKPKYEVQDWLENVERVKNRVRNLLEEAQERKISSLLLGKRVDKLNEDIAKLREQQGRFQGKLLLDVRESPLSLSTTELIGQAFEQNLENICERLIDDEVLRIGIYGMGGVGKTTLALQVHDRLLEESETFGPVYWVTVSQEFSISKLQNDIAKTLKLGFSCEDERKRAAELSRALTQREKCVLILDDVWNHFSLERVGIPNRVSGCKLIVTTRSDGVCRMMGCQEKIEVKPLSKAEAWNLFSEKLGPDTSLSNEVRVIAESVVAECAGLPLGIITMAGSMRGLDDVCEWRKVLEDLKELTMEHEDMEKDVFPILKLSYNRLNDENLKRCFLYCALYPEDYKIERNELVSYFNAEGWIDERKSWEAKFDEGHSMLNKLVRSCLLESCEDLEGEKRVKMHDLIRDMALKITKVSDPRFMVKAAVGLKKIPDEQEWTEGLCKVSLMENEIKIIPRGRSPRCPTLETLILKRNPLTRIANSFFEHMHGIHVLDLSNTNIVKLPNSVSDLENLTALLLEGCELLTYVPPLGKLTMLQELNLRWTAITEVPDGVESLVSLKNLNMEWTTKLKRIRRGALGRLSRVQHISLYCGSEFVAQVEELKGLRELEEFEARLYDIRTFNRLVKSLQCCGPRLKKYSLFLCFPSFEGLPNYYKDCSKVVRLSDYTIKRGGKGDDGILLPYDIKFLEIRQCRFINRSSRWLEAFPSFCGNARDLKFCKIVACRGIEYILSLCSSSSSCSITSSSSHNDQEETKQEADSEEQNESRHIPLQSLEILRLCRLSDLRALFRLNMLGIGAIAPPHGIFSCLRELSISHCDRMNNLFTPGLLMKHLGNLEVLSVESCEQMNEIFDDQGMGRRRNSCLVLFHIVIDGNNHDVSTTRHLPKLKKLLLGSLPELKSICEGILICDSIETIDVRNCPKLKRLPFSLPLVNGQPSAPKLRDLCIKACPQIRTLFSNNDDGSNDTSITTIPNVTNITLSDLPELDSICEGMLSCNSIEVIYVTKCPKLNALPLSLTLVNGKLYASRLKRLFIRACPKIKKLFSNNEEDSNDTPTITLPELTELSLCNLPEVEIIGEGMMSCDSIENIFVEECPKLKRLPFSLPLVNGQPSAPKALREIKVDYDREWWESLEWDPTEAKDVLLPFVSFSKIPIHHACGLDRSIEDSNSTE